MKDHKVVVRNLWRKVRLDSTKQAVGRANGRKFYVCLRDFIRMDNERALHVGAPGTVKVRKPEFPEGSSDVTVRESLDVLTLRSEEVGTWKAYTDDNYVEPEKWVLPG